jgi:hypothetical protein
MVEEFLHNIHLIVVDLLYYVVRDNFFMVGCCFDWGVGN